MDPLILVYVDLASHTYRQIIYLMQADSNTFQEVVNLLLQIKIALQRGTPANQPFLLAKIDQCICKIAPLIDICSLSTHSVPLPSEPDFKSKSSISNRLPYRMSLPEGLPHGEVNSGEELQRVRRSFVRQSVQQQRQEERGVVLDYFVVRYNLELNDYTVNGRRGEGQTDRRVFVDLLTHQVKRAHCQPLTKTPSMTNILKQLFSQPKAAPPLILPNCQQPETKYLFAFELKECGVTQNNFYRTQTFCCFVSRAFILEELVVLVDEISRSCFELRINEASMAEEDRLADTVALLYRKKTYPCIEKHIESYIARKNLDLMAQVDKQKKDRHFQLQIDRYLNQAEVRWSIVKQHKKKQQKLLPTLVLLYYFVLSEYKIILLAGDQNKHVISELIMGVIQALRPMTYVYPIVAASLTQHHFQFANSPVPIIVGLWGCHQALAETKFRLSQSLKAQRNMSREELQKQINFVVVDVEQHSIIFLDSVYKETCSTCEQLQMYIEGQTSDLLSSKLAKVTEQLLGNGPKNPWMQALNTKLKETQMFDYLTQH